MSTPLVKLENINFYYNRGMPSEVHAVKNINLEIERGGYVAFFGPSGCGKTTLTYLIGGIETENTDEGHIIVNGRDIRGLSKKELAIYRQVGVGIIFQQFNLLPSLSVVDNVALPMAFLGINTKRRREEAMRLLERFGMAEYAERFPSELSGGQQQRVSIARALANNPPIIIADEPLGNLDSENANKALEILKELNEKDGRTIIMVTHEPWSLRDAKTIFHIKDGEIIKKEEPEKNEAMKKTISKHFFSQLHPELTPLRVVAKPLSHMLLPGFGNDEIKRLELFLERRLNGEIDTPTFIDFLDAPYKEGGVGLWKQRAHKIATIVEEMVEKRKDVDRIYKSLEEDPETPLYEDVDNLRIWLLDDYKGNLSYSQIVKFEEAVEDRLRNVISQENFQQVLELPHSLFGVGLAHRTAYTVSNRLESILMGKNNQIPRQENLNNLWKIRLKNYRLRNKKDSK